MGKDIVNVLDRMQDKLNLLRENKSCIEYWEDHGDGGFWKPFTDKVASKRKNWNLDDLRVNMWFIVKTDDGIRLLNKEEYETYIGETHILYQGSYQACKDYVKV